MIGLKTVELLPQPVRREHGARATHLRFAENKSKNRDIEIDSRNPEQSPGIWGYQLLHTMQDFRGVILLPLPMERKLRIETDRKHLAPHAKNFFNGGTQIL